MKVTDLTNVIFQWHSHCGVKGGQSSPLTAKNLPKIGKKGEKIRKNREKEGKIGKKRKNW